MPLIDKLKNGLAQFSGNPQQQQQPQTQQPATPNVGAPDVTVPAPTVSPATPAQPPASMAPVNFTAPGVPAEPMDEAQAEFRAQQIITRATQLADQLIADGHIHSFGRNAAITRFTADGFDNEQNGPSLVTFTRANGQVVNDRMELTAELLRATPKHSLFSSQLPVTVFNGNRDSSETKTAAQAGKEQADAYNQQFTQSIPGIVQPSTNGHGAK